MKLPSKMAQLSIQLSLSCILDEGLFCTDVQEAFGSPSKLRRIALDFSSPQQSPHGPTRTSSPALPRRSGTPCAAASRSPFPEGRPGSGSNGGESPGWGQSLRSPSGHHKRSSLLAAISSSIRCTTLK
jgi:hypothetical protein